MRARKHEEHSFDSRFQYRLERTVKWLIGQDIHDMEDLSGITDFRIWHDDGDASVHDDDLMHLNKIAQVRLQLICLESDHSVCFCKSVRERPRGIKRPASNVAITNIAQTVEAVKNKSTDSTVGGPVAAAQLLCSTFVTTTDKREWVEHARTSAIVGSAPKSLQSALSGWRAWFSFAKDVLLLPEDKVLPPTLDGLLAWSTLFRCVGTFTNYLGHVRLATQICKCSTTVFLAPELKRAKVAILKKKHFVPREKLFLRQKDVVQLIAFARADSDYTTPAMMYLCTYVFLLRLPSECLPIQIDVGLQNRQNFGIHATKDSIELWLPCRKNKQLQGSLIQRKCWCKTCPSTCPVHVLGGFLQGFKNGSRPFDRYSAESARKTLKHMLCILGKPDHWKFGTHCLRRGHALDLQKGGGTLRQILEAGDWRSPAYLQYLNLTDLERESVSEAHGALLETFDEESDLDED